MGMGRRVGVCVGGRVLRLVWRCLSTNRNTLDGDWGNLPSMSTACPEAREQSAPVESIKNTWIRCDIGGESADGSEVRGVNENGLPGYLRLATEELQAPNTKEGEIIVC